jgi:DNA-binding Xre family transcriptional regulator
MVYLLHNIMAEKKVSQAELSRRTGISPSVINMIFHERLKPFPGWKKRIAKALQCKVDEIFPPGME